MGRFSLFQRLAVDLAAADDWLIVDFETTGVDFRAEIIQVGIVDPAGDVIFDQLLRPAEPIPLQATLVHGIADRDVAGAPTFPDIADHFDSLVDGRRLLAYNSRFDARMHLQTRHRYALLPSSVREPWTDLMAPVSSHFSRIRYISLSAACELAGVSLDGRSLHTAAADALLAYDLVQALTPKEVPHD